jgi:hypothetical protein
MPHKSRENLAEISCWSKLMGKVPQEVRGKSRKRLTKRSCNTGSFNVMRRHEPCEFYSVDWGLQ